MKSFKITSMLLVALCGLFFASCDDDNDSNPTLTQPTAFTLNTPALADQYVELTESGTLAVKWSQPNYGFPVRTTYKLQVGEVQDDSTIKWKTDENGADEFLGKPDTYTDCEANVKASDIALALCEMDGVTSQDNYVDLGYRKIAIRAYASVLDAQGVEVANSGIYSNAVTFNHLKSYCAVRVPGHIYLIGQPEGWKEPTSANAEDIAPWTLTETGVGTNIYEGTFLIPAGQFQLRFYTELTGWDGGASIGYKEADEATSVTLTNNRYDGDLVAPGKGSWQIDDWTADAYVTFTVNLNTNKVSFVVAGDTPPATPTGSIYVVGAFTGWATPDDTNTSTYDAYKLNEYDNSGIYTGTFEVPQGQLTFKIYSALTGWDGGDAIGAQTDDSNVDVTMTNGVYTGTATVPGKGNWNVTDWAGGSVKIEYNANNTTITITAQ